MLWLKAWCETKWRLFFGLAVPLAALIYTGTSGKSPENATALMGTIEFFLLFITIFLAGTGIKTQPSFRPAKVLPRSLYFTLSLPVSRLTLLAVRVAVGLLETLAASFLLASTVWLMFPTIRGSSSFFNSLELALSVCLCIAVFHLVSVISGIFLEDAWQNWGTLMVVAIFWWITSKIHLPASYNVFLVTSAASPLVTHTLPWPAIAISVGATAILFLLAWKIVQTREF